jgi:hypothetical protein
MDQTETDKTAQSQVDNTRPHKVKSATKRTRTPRQPRDDAQTNAKDVSPSPLKLPKIIDNNFDKHTIAVNRVHNDPTQPPLVKPEEQVPSSHIDVLQLLHNGQQDILQRSLKQLLYYVFYLANRRDVPDLIATDSIIKLEGGADNIDYTTGVLISCMNQAVADLSTWALLRKEGSMDGLKQLLVECLFTPLRKKHFCDEQAASLERLLNVEVLP